MHVMVTGHLGFIGPVMVKAFKDAGHYVTGVDCGFYPATGGESVEVDQEIIADLRSLNAGFLHGVDVVVHLAGLSNDPLGELQPGLTEEINQGASKRLAEMAKEAGVGRFIFASSCSIYGAADVSKPLDENASFNPVSAYAVSKVQTEADLSAMADESFSPVFMRNATAYGVSSHTRMDLVVNNLVACGLTTGEIKVMSDGTPWRPLVHIADIAAAAVALAEAPREVIHNQAFNVGRSDGNYQVKDVAELVKAQLPDAALIITGETGGDPRSYQVSFDKIASLIPSFKPQWTVEKGVTELVEWIKDGGLNGEPFNSKSFIRLKQLKHLMDNGAVDEKLYVKS